MRADAAPAPVFSLTPRNGMTPGEGRFRRTSPAAPGGGAIRPPCRARRGCRDEGRRAGSAALWHVAADPPSMARPRFRKAMRSRRPAQARRVAARCLRGRSGSQP